MRTIDGLFKEIHEMDKESSVSRNFIRQIVISKKIKSIKAGNKYLVDLDAVLAYLGNPSEWEETQPIELGKLRRV